MRGNFTSLQELVSEVERIETTKNDYLVSNMEIQMVDDEHVAIDTIGAFDLNEFAHGQVASKLNIPKKYYDDMEQIPRLREYTVNKWLQHNAGSKYFVRTLDDTARAFLSNSYRPIDNFDVLSSFLPVIRDLDVKIQPGTLSLTEKKMYIPIILPKFEGEVKVGDVVQYGIILTNSEVGAGAVDIKKMFWRLRCSNGMIGESIMRKYHIGSRIDSDNSDIFKDDTIRMEIESFKLRFRDVIADALSMKSFEEQLNKMRGAAEDKIINITDTVMNVTKRFGLSEKHNDLIINNMAEEGNMNRWGLANGLTALAHSIENIDQQYEVEKMGSTLINMSKNEWGKYVAA